MSSTNALKGRAGHPKTIIIEEEERKPKRKKKARKIVVEPQDPDLEIINLLMADIDRELLAAIDILKELNKFYAGLSIQMH